MIDPASLASWAAQLTRLILRYMSVNGVPTTRDQRWAMARRLHPTVEQMRREAYEQVADQLRTEGLRPAPIRPYRPSALVAAIERATDAEPYVRPGARDALERVEPHREQGIEPQADPAPASDRTAAPRARVRVIATDQQSRSRVRVQVAANDLDPQSRRQARSRVVVTDTNRREAPVVRTITERVAATVERHVRQVDRETVVATANSASDEIGWARVLSGSENCAFCAMLASRGPVYRSDKSALSVVGDRRGRTRGSRELGESYHDHCDCDAILVRAGEDWAGREEFERLQRLWTAATAVHPRDATRAFNRSWRRIQRHPELEDAYDQLWAESTEGLEGSAALRAFAGAARRNPPDALDARRRSPSTGGEDTPPPEPDAPQPGPDDTDPPTGPPDNGAATPAPDDDPFDGLPFPHPWTVQQDLDQLTDAERAELRNYAVGGYRAVNDALRGQRPMTADIEDRIALLRSVMDRVPLQRTYRVTRTAERSDLNLGDQPIDETLVGDWLREPAFMSTSGHRNPPYLMNRREPVILDLVVPEGTPGVALDDTITSQEMVEKERELLLADGLRIIVTSVRYDEERQVPRIQGRVVRDDRRDS